MVNLTIDKIAVSVPEGTTILEAAASVGIEIPSLCYLKDINENVNTIQQSDIKYSNTAAEDLNKYTLKLIDMYETSIIGLVGDVDVDRKKLELTRSELFELRAKMFRAHTKRVQKGKCDASLTALFGSLLQDLETIASGCMDIADQVEEQHTIEIDLSSDSDEPIPVLA